MIIALGPRAERTEVTYSGGANGSPHNDTFSRDPS
jgi:hypothetical protein